MRKRDKKITLRFTEEEYKRVVRKLEEGKKVYSNYSNYFLKILDDSNLTVYKINTSDIVKELRLIGNNINQWTRDINVYNEVSKEDVHNLKNEIDKMKKKINELTISINKIKG